MCLFAFVDCFDGMLPGGMIGTASDSVLANSMLNQDISRPGRMISPGKVRISSFFISATQFIYGREQMGADTFVSFAMSCISIFIWLYIHSRQTPAEIDILTTVGGLIL